MNKALSRRFFLVIVGMTLAGSVGAKIVFDPSNFGQNAVTAAKAVRTEINTATAAIQSVQQTIELIKSTTSIDGLARLAGLDKELRLYRDLVNTNQQLVSAVDQSRNLYQNLSAQYGASDFSWKAFLDGRARVDVTYAESLLNQYEAVNRAIESTNSRREAILQQAQTVSGQLGATQTVSAQVDILIGQNQQIMGLLATQIANDPAKQKHDAGMKQRLGAREYDDYQRRLERTVNRFGSR